MLFDDIEVKLSCLPVGNHPDLERVLRSHRRWRQLNVGQPGSAKRLRTARDLLLLRVGGKVCLLLAQLFAWAGTQLLQVFIRRRLSGRLTRRQGTFLAKAIKSLNRASRGVLRWHLRRSTHRPVQ